MSNIVGTESRTASAALAKAAAALRWRGLAAADRERAADLILDTIAVTAAGSGHASLVPITQAAVGVDGPSTVIGRAGGASPEMAALANGAATTVLQLQEGHRLARGHPASHVLPAVLAMAETMDADAEQFLTAFVAGYEVAARIGVALHGVHESLHDAGTWGVIGAASGVCHLLTKADARRIAQAIDGAAAVTLSPFRDTVSAGATILHLYTGLGASNGLIIGRASALGATGAPRTLENFFGPRTGAAFVAESLYDEWRRLELHNAYFKRHPVCAHFFGALDALFHLMAQHSFAAAGVEGVEVGIYANAMHYNTPVPRNDLAARFSLSTAVAVALQTGTLGAYSLNDESIQATEVRELASRVRIRHQPDLDADYPAGRPAVVTIRLKDGRSLAHKVIHPKGDSTNPLTRAEVETKARGLLSPIFTAEGAAAIVRAVHEVAEGAPLRRLTTALRKLPATGRGRP